MPDLRERFDYSAVLEAITQPGLDDLRQRARQRRRRRTVLAAGTVTVLVVLTAVLGGSLLRTPSLDRPAGGTEPTPPAGTRMVPRGFQMVDARHGFAFYERWLGHEDRNGCYQAVRATEDGGRTWSESRPMPCTVDVVGLRALDADTLLYGDVGETFHISHDAGRTWAPHKPRTRTAKVFPAGVTPERTCAGAEVCAGSNELTWYDPATGNRMYLENGPPGLGSLRHGIRATDGSVWIPGYTDDNRYAVAITRDNGRTWRTRPMPVSGEYLEGPVVASHDGRTGYLVISAGTDPQGQRGPARIFRTGDGGGSWTEVDVDPPAKSFGLFEAHVAADGTLLVPGSTQKGYRWYASDDGGETFTEATELPPVGPVARFRDGYHAQDARNGARHHLSEDLLEWREITVP